MENEFLVQSSNSKIYPWTVCLSASLFFFYEFIQMHMFNSISSDLMRDFSINAEQLGHLSSTYFYADAITALFAGIIVDRFSTRKIILIALIFCILATVLLAHAHSFWFAGIFHFIAGIGNAFSFLCCIYLASRWISSKQLALMTGLIVTIAMLGGVVAQIPLTKLVSIIGWRKSVELIAVLGLIIYVIIWRYVKDHPSQLNQNYFSKNKKIDYKEIKKNIEVAYANLQNWFAGLYTCLLNLPIALLCALWGNLYLTQVHNLSVLQASQVSSMLLVGTILGGPFVGWISDRLGSRRLVMVVGVILSFFSLIPIIYIFHLSFYFLLIQFFLIGFFTSSQIITYPVIMENNPKILTGIAMGPASLLIMGGAGLSQPIFGAIMDWHWSGLINNDVRVYSPAAYEAAMTILPIGCGVALLAAFLIKEKNIHKDFPI